MLIFSPSLPFIFIYIVPSTFCIKLYEEFASHQSLTPPQINNLSIQWTAYIPPLEKKTMLLLKMVVVSLVLSASSRSITRRPKMMLMANALSTHHYTHQHHNRRCISRLSSSTTSDTDIKIAKQIKKKEKTAAIKAGREKRAKFIGLAKAVDRGQFQNTYNPGGGGGGTNDGFTAKSGLPNLEKSFCVLGIESSCDDTGGESEYDCL